MQALLEIQGNPGSRSLSAHVTLSAAREPLIGTILSASYHKWDKQGRPIYIQKSGGIDVNRFTTEVAVEKIGVGQCSSVHGAGSRRVTSGQRGFD